MASVVTEKRTLEPLDRLEALKARTRVMQEAEAQHTGGSIGGATRRDYHGPIQKQEYGIGEKLGQRMSKTILWCVFTRRCDRAFPFSRPEQRPHSSGGAGKLLQSRERAQNRTVNNDLTQPPAWFDFVAFFSFFLSVFPKTTRMRSDCGGWRLRTGKKPRRGKSPASTAQACNGAKTCKSDRPPSKAITLLNHVPHLTVHFGRRSDVLKR